MTLGTNLKNKSANPQGARCQKCLEHGHWTYECKGKRKIVVRESRMSLLNKRMKMAEEKRINVLNQPEVKESSKQQKKKKKKKKKEESSSDSSDSASDSSSSSSDSSSDSSDDDSSSSSSSSSD
uniref:Zinc finger CCHC domain-containing protein 10 n=1 Tax=Graphocephala atropunctata TaxID=36148 RepID=A0A1B6M003_9HEMI